MRKFKIKKQEIVKNNYYFEGELYLKERLISRISFFTDKELKVKSVIDYYSYIFPADGDMEYFKQLNIETVNKILHKNRMKLLFNNVKVIE